MENLKIRSVDCCSQINSEDWNSVAGTSPFHRKEWIKAWCETLGKDVEPLILIVEDQQKIVGIAPLYIESSVTKGTVVHFLGAGKACSDYASILVRPEYQTQVISTIANWLTSSTSEFSWSTMSLEGISTEDPTMEIFAQQLGRHMVVDRSPHENSWVIDLPETWDDYLMSLSKRCRRMMRQLDKEHIQSGRATFSIASTAAEVHHGLNVLIELHTARREELGCEGCFSDPEFIKLVKKSAHSFFHAGNLRLGTVYVDERPAAVALSFSHGDSIFAYQCGYDPEFSEMKPGWILNQFQLRYAIENGYRHFDFLRGDEAYKSRLGARPVELQRLRISNNTSIGTLRRFAWSAKTGLKPLVASWTTDNGSVPKGVAENR